MSADTGHDVLRQVTRNFGDRKRKGDEQHTIQNRLRHAYGIDQCHFRRRIPDRLDQFIT
jgi:hypothetical protein